MIAVTCPIKKREVTLTETMSVLSDNAPAAGHRISIPISPDVLTCVTAESGPSPLLLMAATA
jgi:hypothetical protein